MFKLLKKFWPLFMAIGLGLVVGCEEPEKNNPEPQPQEPALSLNQTEISVDKTGGSFSVQVTVANPVEGKTVSVAAPQVDWITDVDTSIENIVQFVVVENETVEERTASFVFSYEGAEDVTCVVKQEAGDPVPFVFENVRVDRDNFKVDVIPANKQATYIYYVMELAYMQDYGLEDDDKLFADDMEYFSYLAEAYGYSLVDFLNSVVYVGDQTCPINNLYPNYDYVGYAYHIDIPNMERTSEVVRLQVTTAQLPLDEIDFNLSAEVDGPNADVTIDPQSYTGYYYYDYMLTEEAEAAGYSEEEMNDILILNWVATVEMYISYGIDLNQIFAECGVGTQTVELHNIKADTDYTLYIFAVDSETAYPTSYVDFLYFTTGSVAASDLVVDIQVKEVSARSVVIDYIASNEEDPYVAGVLDKSEFDALGETDEERFTTLVDSYYFYSNPGSRYDVKMNGLAPETEYVVLAFGYVGEVVNTPFYKEVFETTAAVEGSSVLTINVVGTYHTEEVAELSDYFAAYANPSKAFFAYEIDIEPEADEFYFGLFNAPEEEVSDEEWIEELVYGGPDTYRSGAYTLSYDTPIVMVGFAVDAEGNYGPLAKVNLTITRDNVDDPQEFIDWYFADEEAARQVCVPAAAVNFDMSSFVSFGEPTTTTVVKENTSEVVANGWNQRNVLKKVEKTKMERRTF